jgi:hypothetical protein
VFEATPTGVEVATDDRNGHCVDATVEVPPLHSSESCESVCNRLPEVRCSCRAAPARSLEARQDLLILEVVDIDDGGLDVGLARPDPGADREVPDKVIASNVQVLQCRSDGAGRFQRQLKRCLVPHGGQKHRHGSRWVRVDGTSDYPGKTKSFRGRYEVGAVTHRGNDREQIQLSALGERRHRVGQPQPRSTRLRPGVVGSDEENSH